MALEDKGNVEQSILDAAEHEFLTKGYAGAKTTEIVGRAGVTHAMLHYYYRTKENLFSVFVDRKLEELKSIVLMGFDAEGMTFTEKIRRAMEMHFDFLVQHPGLPRFVLNEIMPKPALFKELKNKINGLMDKSMLAMLAAELSSAIERGEVSSISIYDLILDIVSVNIMTFIALPTVKVILGGEMAESAYLEARRRENVELIMRRLAR